MLPSYNNIAEYEIFETQPFLNTVECRYNTVQLLMIPFMALRWQEQNLYQTSNSQQTPLGSPSRASYGVSIVRILEKIDRVLTAPHCINIRSGTLLQINIQSTRGGVNRCRYAASRNPMYLYLYNIISKYDPTCTYVTPEGYGYNERKQLYSLL